MKLLHKLIAVTALAISCAAPSFAETEAPRVTFLVANPAFTDAAYRQSVVLLGQLQDGSHIGIILNRPTESYLGSLYPDHAPSKQVSTPVHIGGPFNPAMLIALVKAEDSPGKGAVELMPGVHLVVAQETLDRVIETSPNDARYYAGLVAWRPGELSVELQRGLWQPVQGRTDMIFRKDTRNLWDELVARSNAGPGI